MATNQTIMIEQSTTEFDAVLFTVGVIYLLVGIAGVIFNMLDAIAIIIDRALLNNPFYYFILHLCIADTLCLIGLACFTGIAFIEQAVWNSRSLWHLTLVRIFGFMINMTYYGSGWMLVVICFTRLIASGYPHLKQKILTPLTTKLIMMTIWTIYTSMAIPCLFYHSIVYIMDEKSLTWYYNLKAPWPKFFNDYDMSHNIVTMSFIVTFIVWTLIKLRKQSSRATSLGNTQGQRLEFKLFIQCAISGGFYIGEGVMFAIFTRFPALPAWVMFISHMLWVLDHVNNSLVYLILNAKLRKTIAGFLGLRKISNQVTAISTAHQQTRNFE